MKSLLKRFETSFKGFIIGSSMTVPGVSGGTMAILLGIYDQLIASISHFTKDLKGNILYLLKFGIGSVLGMMPGMNAGALKDVSIDEKQMSRTEAIILSMTPQERAKPEILNGSRRKRIANGSGTSVEEVNRLLRQFEQTKKMMKQFSGMEKRGGLFGKGKMKIPF